MASHWESETQNTATNGRELTIGMSDDEADEEDSLAISVPEAVQATRRLP